MNLIRHILLTTKDRDWLLSQNEKIKGKITF